MPRGVYGRPQILILGYLRFQGGYSAQERMGGRERPPVSLTVSHLVLMSCTLRVM